MTESLIVFFADAEVTRHEEGDVEQEALSS